MRLTANCAKAVAPHSHLGPACSARACKVSGVDYKGAQPADSILQKVPRNSSVANEGYSGNGTDITPSSCIFGLHFATGKMFCHYLSDW